MQENEQPPGIPNLSSLQIDKIAAALAKAQSKVKPLVRDLEGKVTGTTKAGKYYEYTYKYAGLDSLYDSFREAAAENDLATIQRFAPGNHLHILLTHASGQWLDFGLYPLGNAEKHQERGSAISYARRYAMACVFGIAPQDDDDGEGGDESLGKRDVPPWPKSIFPAEGDRTLFCENTIDSFQKAATLEGLRELAELNAAKFAEMDASPNEHDRLAVADLRRCYAIDSARLKRPDDSPPATVDQAVARRAK